MNDFYSDPTQAPPALPSDPIGRARAIHTERFIRNLKHIRSPWRGINFTLMGWQTQIIYDLFGTVTEEGLRRYHFSYIEIPKKNGKSELVAAIALYMLCADDEFGGEIYSAAKDRDQAAIIYRTAVAMVRLCPPLLKRCKIIESQKIIYYRPTDSFYKVLSRDVASKHGYNPSAVLFDELHAQEKPDLWNVLTEGAGDAREEPLTIAITTAGWDRASVCWEQHVYAKKCLADPGFDPTFYPVIYSADDKKDNWEDERVWARANPSLGHTIKIDRLREQYKKALESPDKINGFKRLRLNIWTNQATLYIDPTTWAEQGPRRPLGELAHREAFGGLDLSAIKDLTAFVLAFPRDGSLAVDVLSFFWCPRARLHDPKNTYRKQYQLWESLGQLTVTDGNVVDYKKIRADIKEICGRYRVRDINVDRLFEGYEFCQDLEKDIPKTEIFPMGQGFIGYAIPFRQFDLLLESKCLCHGNENLVLNFCAGNLAVETDAAENHKPAKDKSEGKIDGIVALIMALDRLYRRRKKRSVYGERGAIGI